MHEDIQINALQAIRDAMRKRDADSLRPPIEKMEGSAVDAGADDALEGGADPSPAHVEAMPGGPDMGELADEKAEDGMDDAKGDQLSEEELQELAQMLADGK